MLNLNVTPILLKKHFKIEPQPVQDKRLCEISTIEVVVVVVLAVAVLVYFYSQSSLCKIDESGWKQLTQIHIFRDLTC